MEEEYKKLLNATYRYLGFRVRSEKEVRDYLTKKKANDAYIQKIIDSLKKQKFLNDAEFTRMWIESRSRLKAWRIIKFELRQKGISEDIINEFELKAEKKDSKSALDIAQKRLHRLKEEPEQKKRGKLFRYLSSKGFDYDIIKDVVDRIFPR